MKIDRVNYPVFLLGLIILIVEVHFGIHLSIVSNYFKFTIVSAIGAIFISYSVLCISMLLEKIEIVKKALCFLGSNSIIILCVHLIELNNGPWGILYSVMTRQNCPNIIQHIIIYGIKLTLTLICTMIILRNRTLKKIFGK